LRMFLVQLRIAALVPPGRNHPVFLVGEAVALVVLHDVRPPWTTLFKASTIWSPSPPS